MNSLLFTIGFTQKTAEQFFGLLQEAGVQRVIDIRENRAGQLSGFAKYPDIAFFLDRLCAALDKGQAGRDPQPLIFLAAVGPGLLWGGTYLH